MTESARLLVHVDLDNGWIYRDEHGEGCVAASVDIYEQAVPTLLEQFDAAGIQATFFVVAQDLAESMFAPEVLKQAIASGHSIGNHTYSHDPHFLNMPRQEKMAEIARADALIRSTLAVEPEGFRAPGYAVSDGYLALLADLGYSYDSSVLPGPATSMLEAYFKLVLRSDKHFPMFFSPNQRRAVKASRSDFQISRVPQIPICTTRFLRMPVHSAFVANKSDEQLLRMIRSAARARSRSVYLLHGIDLAWQHDPASSVRVLRKPLAHRLDTIAKVLAQVRLLNEAASQ